METFTKQHVAVTGAGGSIGMQICRQALGQGAATLKLISLTEGGLYNAMKVLQREFPEAHLQPVLGSYGNWKLMREVLADVDLLVHAGAHKHVHLCEANPLEAIANNVLGTCSLLSAARDLVPRICVVSSDKAVRPECIMGATKRVVEKLAVHFSTGPAHVSVVRFGNVLDSAGSVLPLWREQIAAGGPLTLTDERCERYFMSIPDAVTLISHAIEHGATGRIYVLNMGERVRMVDIAQKMIADSGKRIPIAITGLRPGEKLIEELNHGGRMVAVTDKVSLITDPDVQLDPRDLDDLWLQWRLHEKNLAIKRLWRLAA